MVQAPNTYPDWIKRKLPIELDLGQNVLTNFPLRSAVVGPPAAQLRYRLIEPRDYNVSFSSTNWQKRGKTWFRLKFRVTLPGSPNPRTSKPRGTVVLLHGYSLDQRRMVPWAFRLAQEGWQCVLPDLRGHGRSTGKRIHFGLIETRDLSQLIDELQRKGQLVEPIAALGESYGATLALRWKAAEARVRRVVAIAPYAQLSTAVLNMRRHNASLIPASWIKAGLAQLPRVLQSTAAQFDLTTVLQNSPVSALFVAGALDNISPPEEVRRLHALASPASRLLIVPDATHEAVPYFLKDLLEPAMSWLEERESPTQAP